jgi:nucleoside-diphosphate-sugar epimerase
MAHKGDDGMENRDFLIKPDDSVLVTGSSGFIGTAVVKTLMEYGFKKIRCFVRPSSNKNRLESILSHPGGETMEIYEGNLLSKEDCERATDGVSVIFHLAAGRGEKSYPEAYLNSVVTTRNLLESIKQKKHLKRFLNVSSLTVYSTSNKNRGKMIDEFCDVESRPAERGEPYCFAKVGQEQIVYEYHKKYDLPFVMVRPGVVYGPGNRGIPGRVGIGTFGMFLHLGGANRIPLTYVDNCAEAIVLAGISNSIEGEVFNVVDDMLPTSREFLKIYKNNVKPFHSIYIPHVVSYSLCYLWEKYSDWSNGQLPPVFNRKKWRFYWDGNQYPNKKIKKLTGWRPKVGFEQAMKYYIRYQREIEGIND